VIDGYIKYRSHRRIRTRAKNATLATNPHGNTFVHAYAVVVTVESIQTKL